jgi:hypothetical protein
MNTSVPEMALPMGIVFRLTSKLPVIGKKVVKVVFSVGPYT